MFGAVGDGAGPFAGRAEEARCGGAAAVPATGQLFVPGTLRMVIRTGRNSLGCNPD